MTRESPEKKDKYKTLIEQTRATRIKPGEKRNPNGRPPNVKYISEYLREKLPLDCKDGTGRTWGEKIADEMLEEATSKLSRGSVPTRGEVLNRTEGKVPDTHKLETDVPVTIIFKPAGDQNATEV